MSQKSKSLLYASVLVLCGVVFLFQNGGATLHVLKANLLFEAAHAKVVSVSVREIEQIGDGEYAELETAFVPAILYEYEVGDRRYSSSRYWATNTGEIDRAWAEKVAASYTPGNDIRVFYDPADPNYSVVTREVSTLARQRISINIGIVLICLFSAGIYLSRLRNPAAVIHET